MSQFDPYAHLYDLDFGDMHADRSMIRRFAARCGSPILELACGTGRALLPLARRGYQVTGVDVSAAMLEVARRKVAAEGLEDCVTLVQQDMRALDLDGRFNLAFVAVSSFMHLLTTDDQLTALTGIHRHLAPGGLLLLDLFNPSLGRLYGFREQMTLDKIMIDPETGHRLMKFHSEQVDLARQTIHTTYIVDKLDDEGRVYRSLFSFSLRYIFRYELELLLRLAGFEIEALYGSYDLDDFTSISTNLIAVARRPE